MTMRKSIEVVLKAAEMRASLDTRDVQIERVSVIVANRDYDARRLDAAAGCEFLDDAIRFEGDPLSSR
jgi:hypothetical protein